MSSDFITMFVFKIILGIIFIIIYGVLIYITVTDEPGIYD